MTLVDVAGRAPLEDAVIVIDGPKITQVGRRGAVTRSAGCHRHRRPREVRDSRPGGHAQSPPERKHAPAAGSSRQPAPDARLGITTVFNPSVGLQDFAALKAASSEDAAPFARFFSTGPAVTMKGDPFGQGSPTPETPQQAEAVARELKAAGVDAIKVQRDEASWMMNQTFPVMKLDVLTALVNEAHQAGLEGVRARADVEAREGRAPRGRGRPDARHHRRTGRSGVHRSDETQPRDLRPDDGAVQRRGGCGGVGSTSGAELGQGRAAAAAHLRTLLVAGGRQAVRVVCEQHGLHERASADSEGQRQESVRLRYSHRARHRQRILRRLSRRVDADRARAARRGRAEAGRCARARRRSTPRG